MRPRGILAVALVCVLAGASLPAAPALAQTGPWEPASELFAHMTGSTPGATRLDSAIRTMVAGAVESSFDWVTQRPRPPGGDQERQRPGDEPAHGEETHIASHPVADPHAQREPCEQAGGTLVEVSERTGDAVHDLGVACVPPEHAILDEHAATRSLARQRLRALRLPGGTITATPGEGLARLPSTLTVRREGRCPPELRLRRTQALPGDDRALPAPPVLALTCTVVARAWFFGDEEHTRTAGDATSVEHIYPKGGRYLVTVRTVRRAQASLDGEVLAEETLVSQATMSYPVAELRAVLTR